MVMMLMVFSAIVGIADTPALGIKGPAPEGTYIWLLCDSEPLSASLSAGLSAGGWQMWRETNTP